MALWRDWVIRNQMKHHWLLNYNQGYGRCPKKKRSCQKEDRVPVDTGYADRVLEIYGKLKAVQEKMHARTGELEPKGVGDSGAGRRGSTTTDSL